MGASQAACPQKRGHANGTQIDLHDKYKFTHVCAPFKVRQDHLVSKCDRHMKAPLQEMPGGHGIYDAMAPGHKRPDMLH